MRQRSRQITFLNSHAKLTEILCESLSSFCDFDSCNGQRVLLNCVTVSIGDFESIDTDGHRLKYTQRRQKFIWQRTLVVMERPVFCEAWSFN